MWSQSSGGKTPQASPASSTSSTATELDEGSTQLEPKTNDQDDASVPIAVQDIDNHLEKRGWGGSAASYPACTPKNSHAQGCGSKRLREQTPRAPQLHDVQGDSSPKPDSVGDERALNKKSPQALPGNPRRKKECLEWSQYPRLDGQHTPGAGPRAHRNQLSNSRKEETMACVRGDVPSFIFHSVIGSPETNHGKRRCQENDERAKVKVAGNGGSDGPEQALAENLPAQHRMDSCGALTTARSFYPTDQLGGDETDLNKAEREPLVSGDNHGATSSKAARNAPGKTSGWLGDGGHTGQPRSEIIPAVTCGNREGRFYGQSTHKRVFADAKVDEASALREAGVTGGEEFKDLFLKLKRGLKWRWGGAVDNLSNKRWICKAGVSSKTAKPGIDKFANDEDVVKYVRGVLGLAVSTLGDQDGQREEERDQDTTGTEGDNGDGEKRDNSETRGEMEEQAIASNQQRPLASTPKERALQAALEALNPSNAPEVLQQRTAEFNQVLRFVTNSVARASGGSLYLCGVPGTGKTQTMAHVQAMVQKMYAKVSQGRVAGNRSC